MEENHQDRNKRAVGIQVVTRKAWQDILQMARHRDHQADAAAVRRPAKGNKCPDVPAQDREDKVEKLLIWNQSSRNWRM